MTGSQSETQDSPLLARSRIQPYYNKSGIERFQMMSRQPYWCSKTKKTVAILVFSAIPPEINSILCKKLSFVLANQYGRWSRE